MSLCATNTAHKHRNKVKRQLFDLLWICCTGTTSCTANWRLQVHSKSTSNRKSGVWPV